MTTSETLMYEHQALKIRVDEIENQLQDIFCELGELQMWKKLKEDNEELAEREKRKLRIHRGEE